MHIITNTTPERRTNAQTDVESDVIRNTTNEWWDLQMYNRITNVKTAARVVAYVRHVGNPYAPVLVVQNKCDEPDQRRAASIPAEVRASYRDGQLVVVSCSARNNDLTDMLPAFFDALDYVRTREGKQIGRARAAAINKLKRLRTEDQNRAPAERKNRVLTEAQIEAMCQAAASESGVPISSVDLFIETLHNARMTRC